MDDLVKRLTDVWLGEEIDNNGIFIEAAKRIEQAAKRIEQLEAALDDVATYLPRAEWHYLKNETLITIGEKKDG